MHCLDPDLLGVIEFLMANTEGVPGLALHKGIMGNCDMRRAHASDWAFPMHWQRDGCIVLAIEKMNV